MTVPPGLAANATAALTEGTYASGKRKRKRTPDSPVCKALPEKALQTGLSGVALRTAQPRPRSLSNQATRSCVAQQYAKAPVNATIEPSSDQGPVGLRTFGE